MSQNGNAKLMPNLDQNSTKLLNLTVLQRIDPFIEEILITAAHVTFYQFNIELSQWSRKDVEGSLFVVKRGTQPRFQFIVMNRRNTDNLVENLLGDFEYEVQGPYLLYRNAAQEVNGIWFYNKQECEEVASLFNRILNAYSRVNQKPAGSSSKSQFEELEAVPTMAVMDGPLEPSSIATSATTDLPDDPAFVNFFSSAMALGNYSNSQPVTVTTYQPPQATNPPPSHAPTIPPALSPSTSIMQLLDNSPDTSSITRMATANLIKPSSFLVPPPSSTTSRMIPSLALSSSMPTAPPLNSNASLQRPYGTPMLQPFPPPTPPPSLTPAPTYGPVIDRDKVRNALLVLVQDNQFIDMVYQALLSKHQQ